MFAAQRQQQQQQQQASPFTSRKRTRDDDDDDNFGDPYELAFSGQHHHSSKRLQNLGRKPSIPIFTNTSSTVTPPNPLPQRVPEPQYQQPPSHFSPWSSQDVASQGDTGMDMDMDMGTMDEVGAPSNPAHEVGRTPTSTQPQSSLGAPLEGAAWSAGPGPALLNHTHIDPALPRTQPHISPLNGLAVSMDHDDDAMVDTVPRGLQADLDWHDMRNRRLPSPISEAGDRSPSVSSFGIRSPDMILDGGGFPGPRPVWAAAGGMQRGDGTWTTGSPDSDSPLRQSRPSSLHYQHLFHQQTWHSGASPSLLTPGIEQLGSPPPPPPAWENGAAMVVGSPASHDGRTSPQSLSPGRKGHMRSRHTLGSPGSGQPASIKALSIGFRADCDKCRDRVPGHFNHFVA